MRLFKKKNTKDIKPAVKTSEKVIDPLKARLDAERNVKRR